MRTRLQNAKIVTPNGIVPGDLLIQDHKIEAILPGDSADSSNTESREAVDETIDCKGHHLIPGVVDDQVHFREPGLTHKEDLPHATKACARGGVTSFLEMPNTNPTTTSVTALDEKLSMANGRCMVNYGFYIGATCDNLNELQNAKRTPGIKIFIGSSTGNLLVDEQAALERIFAETDLSICAHCEDETTIRENQKKFDGQTDISVHSKIRDHHAALVATNRAIDLAVRHKHHFHVLHVSTAAEIEPIAANREFITAEVCPHHLFFNVDDYPRLGSLVKMNPSVKFAEDNQALFQALLDGKIEVIATDHAPHTMEEKQADYPGCPSGLPAVENSLALMLNQVNLGRCSIEQVVSWMCEAPARIWQLNSKGKIETGYDADLVLVDLDRVEQIRNSEQQTKCGWSPWDGESLKGWPIQTWVMGQPVFRRGDANGTNWFSDVMLGQEIEFRQ